MENISNKGIDNKSPEQRQKPKQKSALKQEDTQIKKGLKSQTHKENQVPKKQEEKPKKDFALAKAEQLPISTKHAIELGNFIRYNDINKARKLLEGILSKKVAVPFKRFNFDLGHKRPHLGPAQYPQKAASYILMLLNSAEKNAINFGLDQKNLYISKYIANKGVRHYHTGRFRGRRMKRTHVLIEVREKPMPQHL